MTAAEAAIGWDRQAKVGLVVAGLLLAIGAWSAVSTPRYGSYGGYEPPRTSAPAQPQQGQQFRLGQQGSSTPAPAPAAGSKPVAGRPGAAPVEPVAAGIPGAPPTEDPNAAPGVVAPAPVEQAGADDGGIPGPPPTQSAVVDDGGIPGPPPGQ